MKHFYGVPPQLFSYLFAFNHDDDPDDEGGTEGGGGASDTDLANTGEKGKGGEKNAEPAPPAGESDELKAMRAKLEKERKQREALEKEKQAREDEKKSELEKAQDKAKKEAERAEAAESKYAEMVRDNAVRDALLAEGARADRVAALLRVVDKSGVTHDDSGELVGAEAAAKAAKAEYPEFFGDDSKPTANASTGGGKPSDKGEPEEPESDYEVGRALAKQGKAKQNRI